MAFTDKPDIIPEFARVDSTDPVTGQTNVIEPPESKKDAGWDFAEKPARNWMNWLFRGIYQWINYFRQFFSETHQFIINEIVSEDGEGVRIQGVPSYDKVIKNQTEFDAVFSSGAQLADTSIFIVDNGSYYNLNNQIELSSNVMIHSNGATVRRNTSEARFRTLGMALGVTSVDEEIFTMDGDVTAFVSVGDIIYTSLDDVYYTVAEVSGNTIGVTRDITGTYVGAETLVKCHRNIHCSGWKFDGRCNVHGLGGSFLSTTNGAFYLNYVIDSSFTCEVYNFKAQNGGAYTSTSSLYNVVISNIHDCYASSRGGACFQCTYSKISNISRCIADMGGGGCYACDNSTISYIYDCWVGLGNGGAGCYLCNDCIISHIYRCYCPIFSGGGCYQCDRSIISHIYDCKAYQGGGCSECSNSRISHINNCSATNQGGGCSGCTLCTISHIYNCSSGVGGGCSACFRCTISHIYNCSATNNGGGCYACNYCRISEITGCSATNNGGGCYACNYSSFFGYWSDNYATTYDTLYDCSFSIAFMQYEGSTKISTVPETLNLD